MRLSIRRYRESDRSACRNLWRELTQRHREIYVDSSIGGVDPGRQFDDYLKRQDLEGPWVVEYGSVVVALAGLLVEGTEGEVEPVVVRSDYRSQGIGTELLRHLKEEARRRGLRSLSIRPVARNAEAIACFHRNGFTVLGHVEMFLDLSSERRREWRRGIEMHEHDFLF